MEEEQDKIAFLHVACLLNGYPFNHVTSLLDDGRPRMNHLTAKSLSSISTDGCINMHFLVVLTGRAIVCQESKNRPSRQRCLWDTREIYHVLDNNIVSSFPSDFDVSVNSGFVVSGTHLVMFS